MELHNYKDIFWLKCMCKSSLMLLFSCWYCLQRSGIMFLHFPRWHYAFWHGILFIRKRFNITIFLYIERIFSCDKQPLQNHKMIFYITHLKILWISLYALNSISCVHLIHDFSALIFEFWQNQVFNISFFVQYSS